MPGNDSHEYNRTGMIAFLFSMVFVFVFFFYIIVVNKGIDLRENVQDPAARALELQEPPLDLATVKEPWVSSDALVKHGKKMYQANCLMCHGAEGLGNGPSGAGLVPPPRNLVEGKWKLGNGIIAHYNVLLNGSPGTSMASYKSFSPAERWALLHFIESITQSKSTDDPAKVADFAKTAQ